MNFISTKIEGIINHSTKAEKFIELATKRICGPFELNKTRFNLKVKQFFQHKNITDQKEIAFNKLIKTEYLREFNSNKIDQLIAEVVDVANENLNPNISKLNTEPDNNRNYSQLVNIITESAKVSSKDQNLVFGKAKMESGIYLFIFASSLFSKNSSLFGKEGISTTLLYCGIFQSIQAIKEDAVNEGILIDLSSIKKLKETQAQIINTLAHDIILLGEWQKKDDSYSKIMQEIQSRIKKSGPLPKNFKQLTQISKEAHQLAVDSLSILKSKSDIFRTSYKRTQSRLATGYF